VKRAAVCIFSTLLILATGHEVLESCTIGVAAGDETRRPLLWKIRDCEDAETRVTYADSGHGFVHVWDTTHGPSRARMGINTRGFAIVNADVAARTELNGTFMFDALATCATVDGFQAFVDGYGVAQEDLHGNFAVIDSSGAAAMFEIRSNPLHVLRTDVDSFAVRTNFYLSLHPEPPGTLDPDWIRYLRSTALVGGWWDEDVLDARRLVREHARDFAYSSGNAVPVPRPGRTPNRPYGYVFTGNSICGHTSTSAVVIEGVLPGEPPARTTMWTALGQPAAAITVPYWPVPGTPSSTADGLRAAADAIRGRLFDVASCSDTTGYDPCARYLDSYRLRNDALSGVWDHAFPVEDSILVATEAFLAGRPDTAALRVFERETAGRALTRLEAIAAVVETIRVHADFTANHTMTCVSCPEDTVHFRNRSLHNPTSWLWSFGDGDTSPEYDAEHAYSETGIFVVTLEIADSLTGFATTARETITVTSWVGVDDGEPGTAMRGPRFLGASPSPFAGEAAIRYALPRGTAGRLDIYDVGGRLVRTLACPAHDAGEGEAIWDGRDASSRPVSSGVYYARLTAKGRSATGRLVLLR